MADWIWVKCSLCGSQVTTPVPPTTQVRAWIECYDCNRADKRTDALRQLVLAVYDAATKADWGDLGLIDALEQAERCF